MALFTLLTTVDATTDRQRALEYCRIGFTSLHLYALRSLQNSSRQSNTVSYDVSRLRQCTYVCHHFVKAAS